METAIFPEWMKKRVVFSGEVEKTRALLKRHALNSVCQGAHCPNISECFARRTATFMILGHRCTRKCTFCAVEKGSPHQPDSLEPENLARAVLELELRHVVITSVTRDDLPDGGAEQFARVIKAVRDNAPDTAIEVLVPDFAGLRDSIKKVVQNGPDIVNHNVETVPRLYSRVRPQADYGRSLKLLADVKKIAPTMYTKSGMMVGLGEQVEEILAVMADLRRVGCDFLTIGQYLRPSEKHYSYSLN